MARKVHAHYRLQTAEFPQRLLVKRSLGKRNVVEQIIEPDVVIWDEIPMSSQRVMETVVLLQVSKNELPIAGKLKTCW